jgi:hypothetical protein
MHPSTHRATHWATHRAAHPAGHRAGHAGAAGRRRGRGSIGLGQHLERRRLLRVGLGERHAGADAADHDAGRTGQEKSSHDQIPSFCVRLCGPAEEMTAQGCAGAPVR